LSHVEKGFIPAGPFRSGKGRMVSDKVRELVHAADQRYDHGDFSGAVKLYEKALKLDPNDSEAWNNKGVSLAHMGRHDEAIECYEKAQALRPGNWKAWYNLGVAYHRTGRLREALGCYDRSIELRPDHFSAMDNKAVALRALRHDDEALGCYDALLAANPFYEPAWRNKGHLLTAMGDIHEARICFEMADMIDPHSGAQAPPKKAPGTKKGAASGRPAPDAGAEPDIIEGEEKEGED